MPVDPHAAGIGLHMAARDGHLKLVRALLERRDPAVDIEERDPLGDTGLLKAARYGRLEVVNALLEAGADLLAQDNNNWSCLHVAIANNHSDIFLALLSSTHDPPADIEALTSAGDTPLHMAAYHGRKWAARTLLQLGADRDARNNEGKVPHDVARKEDVQALLRPDDLSFIHAESVQEERVSGADRHKQDPKISSDTANERQSETRGINFMGENIAIDQKNRHASGRKDADEGEGGRGGGSGNDIHCDSFEEESSDSYQSENGSFLHLGLRADNAEEIHH